MQRQASRTHRDPQVCLVHLPRPPLPRMRLGSQWRQLVRQRLRPLALPAVPHLTRVAAARSAPTAWPAGDARRAGPGARRPGTVTGTLSARRRAACLVSCSAALSHTPALSCMGGAEGAALGGEGTRLGTEQHERPDGRVAGHGTR